MNGLFDLEHILKLLSNWNKQLIELLNQPYMWLQLLFIAVVFVLARWLLTPFFRKSLISLASSTTRIPNFRKPIMALLEVINPIAWLVLQWIAIGVAKYFKWPVSVLTVVASLLTAWVLIRFASMLVVRKEIARFIAITAWSIAALSIFGLIDSVTSLLDSWAVTLGNVRLSPLTVVKVGLSLWFALWLANGISSLVEKRLAKSEFVAPTVRVLGAKLTRISLIAAALLIALSAVGIDLTALAVFSGALGVGLGFGLQRIFSNLVSGVFLLLDRSIKPGDVIAVSGTFGWINHLGARYTSVITRDGIEHLIPNEELITQRVENWSFTNALVRVRIPIGISYDADPRQAMELCLNAAKMVPRVLLDPEPRINLTAFGESSVNLELRIWIEDPVNGRGNVISEVLLGIWDAFHENGIHIPYPQRDIHIKTTPVSETILEIPRT